MVRNIRKSPFHIVDFKVRPDNLLLPYFKKEAGRFSESGLGEMWDKVHRIAQVLRHAKLIPGERITLKRFNIRLGM